MQELATELANKGFVLRSGGATGADTAFEEGCVSVNGPKEIYLPWKNFGDKWCRQKTKDDIVNILPRSFEILEQIAQRRNQTAKGYPYWMCCLFARNMHQILGQHLNNPSKFVICWTPNGEAVGGTRWAIWCAKDHNVPVFNLANQQQISVNEILDRIST